MKYSLTVVADEEETLLDDKKEIQLMLRMDDIKGVFFDIDEYFHKKINYEDDGKSDEYIDFLMEIRSDIAEIVEKKDLLSLYDCD